MCTDFIRSSKEKMFRFVADELRTDIQNMIQAPPSLPSPSKPEDLKVFDDLSRAAFAKRTSYNWRNVEATYLVLLTRYCLFDIQRNSFHCKTHLAWYEISVYYYYYFFFHNIHYIGFTGKNSFKLKILVNVLNLKFEVWIYFVSHVIQKKHD